MMKKSILMGVLLPGVMIFSCETKKLAVGDTSQNALDWSGVYLFTDDEYKMPEIQLTLNDNNTYKLVLSAFEEERKNTYINGTFEWDKEGRTIALDKKVPHFLTDRLVVGENRLFVLSGKNAAQKPLEELPQLNKIQTDPDLAEKYWKLLSINDREVTKDDFINREPHLLFKSEFSRVGGNDGCNGFGGVYRLDGNTITFDKMMSTMMACPDSFVFEKFMGILHEGTTYSVADETLTIQSKNDVMKFVVVYL